MPSLGVFGYLGNPVTNQFVRGNQARRTLGVLLPGLGYSCDMPAMYYAQNILESLGADVFRIEYGYSSNGEFLRAPGPVQEAWIRDDVTNAYRVATQQDDYEEVIFIAKSIGTKALSFLLSSSNLAAATKAIWLTPLLGEPQVCETLHAAASSSLVVIGAKEAQHYAEQANILTRKLGPAWLVVESVDHGFDVPGDVEASVEALRPIVRAMLSFLCKD